MRRDDPGAAAGFLARLPGFLRRPISAAEAATTLAARLAARERDFLHLAESLIFAAPASPYRALLAHAGCEYGDLERLVRGDGVEAALRALARGGVYLTVHELKGRVPVVRGSTVIEAGPARLRNPRAAGHLSSQTSGSGGARTAVPIDLAYVRDCAVDSAVMLRARGGDAWVKGHWAPLGGGAMMSVLQFSAFGAPAARWFSHVDPRDRGLHPRYRWAARGMGIMSRLARRPLPWPEHVPPDAPLPVAVWMRETLRGGGTPHLLTYPSSAARLGEYARAHGIDLAGAQVTIGGEPITARRLATSRAGGATVVARYGTAETGPIGLGCLAAQTHDEVHVLTDLHALVRLDAAPQPPLPPAALYLTSLRPTTPFVLLNVSFGDTRACSAAARAAVRCARSAGPPTCTPSAASRSSPPAARRCWTSTSPAFSRRYCRRASAAAASTTSSSRTRMPAGRRACACWCIPASERSTPVRSAPRCSAPSRRTRRSGR